MSSVKITYVEKNIKNFLSYCSVWFWYYRITYSYKDTDDISQNHSHLHGSERKYQVCIQNPLFTNESPVHTFSHIDNHTCNYGIYACW